MNEKYKNGIFVMISNEKSSINEYFISIILQAISTISTISIILITFL